MSFDEIHLHTGLTNDIISMTRNQSHVNPYEISLSRIYKYMYNTKECCALQRVTYRSQLNVPEVGHPLESIPLKFPFQMVQAQHLQPIRDGVGVANFWRIRKQSNSSHQVAMAMNKQSTLGKVTLDIEGREGGRKGERGRLREGGRERRREGYNVERCVGDRKEKCTHKQA